MESSQGSSFAFFFFLFIFFPSLGMCAIAIVVTLSFLQITSWQVNQEISSLKVVETSLEAPTMTRAREFSNSRKHWRWRCRKTSFQEACEGGGGGGPLPGGASQGRGC